jgi:type-F conjugative transfer system pilin assembly protein TrbC
MLRLINTYLYTYIFISLLLYPGISYGIEAQDNGKLWVQDIQKRAQQDGFDAHGLVDSALRNAGGHEAPGENKLTDSMPNSTQQKRFNAQELVDNASRNIEREIKTGKHKALIKESSKQLTEERLADAKELAEQVNLKQKQLSLKDLGIEVTGGKLADKNGINIGELLSRYNSKDFLEKDSDQLPGLMVFISLSMPENSLNQLAIQIRQAGGVLVLRGMYEGSLQKTINAIYELNKQGVSAIIHPEFFRKYDVRAVPTFVLENKEEGKCKFGNCTRVFDKLTGNVSLKYVLEQFASEGSNPKVAQQYLERIGGTK